MKYLWMSLLFAWVTAGQAATYFIDYAGGNNANNGLSKGAAWKTHPYMASSGPAYSHSTGDRFVFKGGVTWPNSCFTMHILLGGSVGNPDIYTTEASWYSGGSWTQPIWDAGGVELPGGYDVLVLFNLANQPSNVRLENIDMERLYWNGTKSYSWVAYVNLSVSSNIVLSGCKIENWTHGTYGAGTRDDLKIIIGANSSPFNPGCLLTNCVMDGVNAANSTQGLSSGEASAAYSGDFVNCQFRNMISGPIGTGDPASLIPQVVSGCDIGPTYMSFDGAAHPDALFMNGGNLFYWHDNYVHDNYIEAVFCGNGSGSENTYIWNNVIYANPTHNPVDIDARAAGGGKIRIWNNTMVGGGFAGVRLGYREGYGPLGALDIRNNLIISDIGILTIDTGNSVVNYTNSNNVLLSTAAATAAGYTLANRYQPTSGAAPTVGVGANFSSFLGGLLATDILDTARPAPSSAWDAGAYQYNGAPPPPPTVRTLTIASSTPSSGVSIDASPADNNGHTTGSTSFDRLYNDSTAVTLTAPSITGGSIFQEWQRGGITLTTNVITTVTMDSDYTLTAVYALIPPPPPPPPPPSNLNVIVRIGKASVGNARIGL